MHLRFVIWILLLLPCTLFAQTEAYRTTLETFKIHFNNNDGTAVYGMMAPNMQEALSLEDVSTIVATFRKNLGTIQTFTFLERNNSMETYETLFENGKQNIILSLNETGLMNGLRFTAAKEDNRVAKMERNKTPLALPLKGSWFTVWGGDTKADNYHVISKPQKNAFDFLIIGYGNRTYQRSGTRNEDYYAFGKPIFAVCDAEVYQVITGVEDNKPGEMNPAQALGNSVILKTENDEYIVYAHFEKETLKVLEGDVVKKGQYLGNCGNSGNSSEPHLHLHIQDGPNVFTSIGVKCYFENLMVNGEATSDYSPVRLDVVAPLQN